MQRSSIIATVIAAGGVLVAGSVASVAVISASSTPSSESETVNLVAAGAPTEAPPVAQVAAPAPVVTPEAVAPTLEASKLPKIPVVGDDAKPASQPQAQPAAQTQTQTQARQPSRQSSSSSKPRPSSSPREVSSSKASSTVVNALGGGTVVSVSKATRGGFSAWAVKVQRNDGSVVTGYVDRATGTAYDWVENKKAPAPTPAQSASSNDDDSDDDHSDDHDSDDDSDDNSGSGHSDDHDSDDDDD